MIRDCISHFMSAHCQWTPHSSLENDNSLNHSCISHTMGCFTHNYKKGHTEIDPGVANQLIVIIITEFVCIIDTTVQEASTLIYTDTLFSGSVYGNFYTKKCQFNKKRC